MKLRDKFLEWLAFKLQKQLTPYLPEKVIYIPVEKIVYLPPIIPPPMPEIKRCEHQIDKLYVQTDFIPNTSLGRSNAIDELKEALFSKASEYIQIFEENPKPNKYSISIGMQLQIIKPTAP